MKAKITEYDGVGFRSRTEALWCKFFSNLGVRFEYEPENIKTSTTGYVPDFYFRSLKTWVEIKGKTPTSDEIKKLKEVCISTNKTGLIISNFPNAYPNAFEPHLSNCMVLIITRGGDTVKLSADFFYQSSKNINILRLVKYIRDSETSGMMKIGERIRVDMLIPAKAKFKPKNKTILPNLKMISRAINAFSNKRGFAAGNGH